MNHAHSHRIAGIKTSADWEALRPRLLTSSHDAWREAFGDFYEARLNLRYLTPIKVLQVNGTFQGEGFAIVAIQCSLIEFLESSEVGINYRYVRRSEDLGPYEYKSSRSIFVKFLTERAPFSAMFNVATAQDLYTAVRCGLLHEAQTKNGWRIRAKSPNGAVVNVAERILYRDNFQDALLAYVKNYGERLLCEPNLQQAFIRKFDYLCE